MHCMPVVFVEFYGNFDFGIFLGGGGIRRNVLVGGRRLVFREEVISEIPGIHTHLPYK